MKRLLILFALCILVPLAAENWNIFVYMAADNNLSFNAKQQINEMEAVAQPAGLNIILQADFPEGAKRYKIQQDSSPGTITSPVLQNMGYIDSGYWQTLQDFLKWGRKKYPAQRNMLVIWGHGDSWFKEGEKWVATDNSSGNGIGVANKDLQKALDGTGHWDILLFDACSMQSMEVLTELIGYCSYVIGSEDLLPARGFPYGSIIPIMNQNPALVAAQIPALFYDSYLPGGIFNPYTGYLPTTCSSISLIDFPAFLSNWKVFSRGLRNDLDELLGLRKSLFEMNDGLADIDMKQFLLACEASGFAGASRMLNQWESLVVGSSFTNQDNVQNIGSAALWFPNSRMTYDALYRRYMRLDFLQTGWLGTLKRALGDDSLPPSPFILKVRILGDKMFLDCQVENYPDSLYYRVDWGSQATFFYPEAYSNRFTLLLNLDNYYSHVQIQSISETGEASQQFSAFVDYGAYKDLVLAVTPNPSHPGDNTRALWHSGDYPKCNVEVYNLKGQLVFKESAMWALPLGELDLHNLDAFKRLKKGKYLLRIDLGKKSLQTKFSVL